MSDVLTIAGSPSANSRSSVLLAHIRTLLSKQGLATDSITVRDLPAEDLLRANIANPAIKEAVAKVQEAQAIVIATPIYKAAYAGVLKVFLDLLPQNALADKIVFPIATGGAPGHLLAIDYSLKPVLGALGAQYVLNGLYVVDDQLQHQNSELVWVDQSIEQRLTAALHHLVRSVTASATVNPTRFVQPIH